MNNSTNDSEMEKTKQMVNTLFNKPKREVSKIFRKKANQIMQMSKILQKRSAERGKEEIDIIIKETSQFKFFEELQKLSKNDYQDIVEELFTFMKLKLFNQGDIINHTCNRLI